MMEFHFDDGVCAPDRMPTWDTSSFPGVYCEARAVLLTLLNCIGPPCRSTLLCSTVLCRAAGCITTTEVSPEKFQDLRYNVRPLRYALCMRCTTLRCLLLQSDRSVHGGDSIALWLHRAPPPPPPRDRWRACSRRSGRSNALAGWKTPRHSATKLPPFYVRTLMICLRQTELATYRPYAGTVLGGTTTVALLVDGRRIAGRRSP